MYNYFRPVLHFAKSLPTQQVSLSVVSLRYHSRAKSKLPAVSFEDINIRNMRREELYMLQSWAKEEGWNPGQHEVAPFYAADHSGYYLLEVNKEPAASLAAIKYSPDFAFLGLYIVRPKFRGLGLGQLLWNTVMKELKNYPAIGLDGVSTQIKNYEKLGFVPFTPNEHWAGIPHIIEPTGSFAVKTLDKILLTSVIDYDASIFSVPRAGFLTGWTKMPESHVSVVLDENEKVIGYGVISRSVKGYHIAPLFADDVEIARFLYEVLCKKVSPGSVIHADVLATNPLSGELLKKLGLTKTFSTLRMYRGVPPPIQYSKLFALTTLDIG